MWHRRGLDGDVGIHLVAPVTHAGIKAAALVGVFLFQLLVGNLLAGIHHHRDDASRGMAAQLVGDVEHLHVAIPVAQPEAHAQLVAVGECGHP